METSRGGKLQFENVKGHIYFINKYILNETDGDIMEQFIWVKNNVQYSVLEWKGFDVGTSFISNLYNFFF